MQTSKIGAGDAMISRIGVGCWAFGGGTYWGEQSQRDVELVVRRALDNGVNFFDTARMYNDGASEISLGRALADARHRAVICSKVSPAKAYRNTLREECEASLRNLRTDYIDIYMLHWPISLMSIKHFTEDTSVLENPPTCEEALSTLAELKREGKIREIGVSNFGLTQLRKALELCPDLAVNELPYSILSRAIEAEILPFCAENSISVITTMSLQQGVLAGSYKNAGEVPPPQAHSRHFRHERGGELSRHCEEGAEEEMFETVDMVRELAAELGVSPAQLSIAWVLCEPGVSSALVGSRNEAQLMENIEAMRLVLPGHIKERLDKVSQGVLDKLGNNPDYYENSRFGRIY